MIPAAMATNSVVLALLFADSGGDATPVGVVALLTQLGLSGIFLWQWRDERTQRQKRDDQLLNLTTQLVPLLTKSTEILTKFETSVADTFQQAVGVSAHPSSLEQAIVELTVELKGRKEGV